jgi:hypothetical protein
MPKGREGPGPSIQRELDVPVKTSTSSRAEATAAALAGPDDTSPQSKSAASLTAPGPR